MFSAHAHSNKQPNVSFSFLYEDHQLLRTAGADFGDWGQLKVVRQPAERQAEPGSRSRRGWQRPELDKALTYS